MEEIIKICQQLKKLSKCEHCGGIVLNGTCKYCRSKSQESIDLINKLKSLLGEKQSFDVLAELVNIKNLEIPFVNDILETKKGNIKIVTQICMDFGDYDKVINLISKDNSHEFVNPDFFIKIFKEYLDGKFDKFDEETYIKFMEIYISRILKLSGFKTLVNRTPKIRFVSSEQIANLQPLKNSSCHGLCVPTLSGDKIYLNRDAFLRLRFENPLFNMRTIYHELEHIVQKNFYKNPERYNLCGLLIAKDMQLRDVIPNYYNENYSILPAEIDAEYNAIQCVIGDIKQLGLQNKELEEEAQNLGKIITNFVRFIDGKETTVDELFDTYVNDVSCLKECPILNLQYKDANGVLTKKTKEEILASMPENMTPEMNFLSRYLTKPEDFSIDLETTKKI